MKETINGVTYDTTDSKKIFSWSSVTDYDPENFTDTNSYPREHWIVYKTASSKYFLHYKIRKQESWMGKVYDGEQHIRPLSIDEVVILAVVKNVAIPDFIDEQQVLVNSLTSRYSSKDNIESTIFKKIYEDFQSLRSKVQNDELGFKEEFLTIMVELEICLKMDCRLATLSLCGRILELCLQEFCNKNGIHLQDSMTIGQIIKEITRSGLYIDKNLENIWSIINGYRIRGVHVKSSSPPPSEDDILVVFFAISNAVKQMLF